MRYIPPLGLPSASDPPGNKAVSAAFHRTHIWSNPWTRLRAHALLRESLIFPGLELGDNYPGYTPYGFTDIWKGNYHGEPVCIQVIRGRELGGLREIEGVR